ncbi:anaerobic dehydrogenase-like protein [Candidatus Magnetoovum chiemensis]|nr:anaerobic dehydrogenase-like protein [Candidatus Magnetoovum chiemensis]
MGIDGGNEIMMIGLVPFKRSLIYELLSHAFSEPSREFIGFVQDGDFYNQISDNSSLVPHLKTLDTSLVKEASMIAKLEGFDYIRSQFRALSSPQINYFYECNYHSRFSAFEEMADIAGFYKAFMLDFSMERPDYLSYELEFMRCLTLMEAKALFNNEDKNVEVTASAQAKFLDSHLGRWFGLIAQHLSGSNYYKYLSDFTNAFIAAECGYLNVSPQKIDFMPQDRSISMDEDTFCPLSGTLSGSAHSL